MAYYIKNLTQTNRWYLGYCVPVLSYRSIPAQYDLDIQRDFHLYQAVQNGEVLIAKSDDGLTDMTIEQANEQFFKQPI